MFETFCFSTMDHSALIMCVRMTNEATSMHAQESFANVEVKFEKLHDLGISLPQEKKLRTFAKYSDFLHSHDMFVTPHNEIDIDRVDVEKEKGLATQALGVAFRHF